MCCWRVWVYVSSWVTVRKSTEDLAEISRKQRRHTLTHLWFSKDWESTKLLMNCYCTGKGNPVLKQYIPESLGSCVCVNTYKPIYVFACTLGAPSGPKKTIIQSVIMITGISLHIQTHSENYELGFLPIFEKPLYLNPFCWRDGKINSIPLLVSVFYLWSFYVLNTDCFPSTYCMYHTYSQPDRCFKDGLLSTVINTWYLIVTNMLPFLFKQRCDREEIFILQCCFGAL